MHMHMPWCRYMYSLISADLLNRHYISPHGHWTCSFMCHFNSQRIMQPTCHFDARNTLPSLFYTRYTITPEWERSTWEWMGPPSPRTYTRTQATYPRTQATYTRTQAAYPRTYTKTQAIHPWTQATYPRTQATYSRTYSRTQATHPRTQATYPRRQATFQRTHTTCPRTQATYSRTYPRTQATHARSQATYPRTQETYPRTQATYPRTYSRTQTIYWRTHVTTMSEQALRSNICDLFPHLSARRIPGDNLITGNDSRRSSAAGPPDNRLGIVRASQRCSACEIPIKMGDLWESYYMHHCGSHQYKCGWVITSVHGKHSEVFF